ncbi:MAG TPA: hypothetical protein VJ302_24265 [Blastocatellia bacterium]|nr:hypothetical protein [Blastocatellia bacterium]
MEGLLKEIDVVSAEDVFGRVEGSTGTATIETAVGVVLDRARSLSLLPRPWSLTELGPTDYDYTWLRVWVQELDESTFSYSLCPLRRFGWDEHQYPLRAALGLLLMFWFSESARREAVEGEGWQWVPQEAIQPQVRSRLFVREQPSSALKDLLEVAARRFNLRHVFGRAGAQQWVETVFLQSGFTRRGFERRLPEWLAGRTSTPAIRQLLEEETGAPGFKQLWQVLLDYRQRKIEREGAGAMLSGSPWLLPEWRERILTLATVEVAEIATGLRLSASETAPEANDSFLSEPLFSWDPPSAPYFRCRLAYLDALGLNRELYHVVVDGRYVMRVSRREDGGYEAEADLYLPFEAARVTVQLVESTGAVAAAEEIELWPESEDVVVFQLSTGRRLADSSRQRLETREAYAVLTAPDLWMEPGPSCDCSIGGGRLFRLDADWSAETHVCFEDEILWEPCLPQLPAAEPPAWVASVYLSVDPSSLVHRALRWGDRIHLKISHPAEVTVSFVRYRGGPMEFETQSEYCTWVGPISLTPEAGSADLRLQLGLKHQNESYRVFLGTDANLVGVAKQKNSDWKTLTEQFVLRSETARQFRFRIAPPRSWDYRERSAGEWALMEGGLWLKNLSVDPEPIGEVAGLGAPLTLRLGPHHSDGEAMTVAQAVIDRGVVDQPRLSDGALQLRLSRPIAPGDRHYVVYWDVDGQLHYLPLRPQDETPHDLWQCELPAGTPDYVAVAPVFEGRRMGVWWRDDWYLRLGRLSESDPHFTALLVRWFGLPLLAERPQARVREIAHRHAPEFLTAWLQEETAAPPPFNLTALTEGWLAAVRAIFLDWMPDPDAATRLLTTLCEQDDAMDCFQRWVWRLLAIDPRLFHRVLTAWLSVQPWRQSAGEMLDRLRWQIAEAGDETEYSVQRGRLLAESAREWRVPPDFIERELLERAVSSARGEALSEREEVNLTLAVGSESLRRLLAVTLVKSMT